MLWEAYEQTLGHEHEARLELMRLARREEPVRRFEELPGFGWIRALTFYVYIDTPWRFPGKSALWRYCGLGLERRHSGAGPMNVRLSKQANRRLKNVLLGAAKSAIAQGDNPFRRQVPLLDFGGTASVHSVVATWLAARRRRCGACGEPATRTTRSWCVAAVGRRSRKARRTEPSGD